MIACNFTNPPNIAPDAIDVAARTAEIVAAYPGFGHYVFHNPDQPGSSGEGMGWPYDLYGPAWKDACKAASPGKLWARVGGFKTNDVPATAGKIDTLCKRLRPSPGVLFDYMSGAEAEDAAKRVQPVVALNGMVCVPEANAKRPYIVPDANTWICAEWFLWDWPAPVPNALNGWNANRWKIQEVIAKGAKVIVEITSMERKGFGYVDGVDPWSSARVGLAKMFHAIDPANVIVSVRMSGMSAAQVAVLRGMNT